MRDAILNCRWFDIMYFGCVFFAGLYIGFGLLNELLIRLLPICGHGGKLDPRALGTGQPLRELVLSAISVLIFGIGSVVPWGFLQLRWSLLAVDPPWWQISLEAVALPMPSGTDGG
jgi:hypothetical protein